MQNSVEVPQETKNRTIRISSNPISGNILTEMNQYLKEVPAPLCLLQHYLQQPRHGNNLHAHQGIHGFKNVVYIYIGEGS